MRAISRAASAASLALAALHFTNPVTAGAQPSCAPASRAFAGSPTPSTVLDKQVTLHAGATSLREALDRIANAAGVRISYAAEQLPLGRTVCASFDAAPLGTILSELLDAVAVRVVVVGKDQLVLAPDANASETSTPQPTALKQVGLLERVVVTGNNTPAIDRASTAAINVVSGDQIARRGAASISRALDGSVPGLWVWEQSPLSMLARYGSIRGASSFGVSYPKVYVDGIEVANSLLVTHMDPDAVSRVEVIRGPQGAALYGANAISGVMNIVTRQEGTDNGAARVQIKSRGGASASDYSPSSVLAQSHAATLRYGTNARSLRLGATATRIGAFIPDAFSQQLTANGSGRYVGSRTILSSTFRIFAQDARAPSSPLETLSRLMNVDSSDQQSVRQFTLGGTATFARDSRWTYSATAGVDGYRLRSAALLDTEFPSAIDSALHDASGSAVRATFKANSVGTFGNPDLTAATLTFGVEHSVVRDKTSLQNTAETSDYAAAPWSLNEIRSNTGLIAQMTGSYRNALFLSGGIRVERNTSPTGLGDIATLPMVGASAVKEFGPATLKLRSAYGKAIRPVQTAAWTGTLLGLRGSLLGSSLTPEEQSGLEIGADAFVGRYLAFHATRFDQHASGLVQPVGIAFTTMVNRLPQTRVAYQLQNVGEITNRGWEFQGSVADGPWSLGATYSRVDSRVHRLASRYTGDLREGDRMLEVPSRTYGVNGAFSSGRWSAAATVSRASDWVNYDRLALIGARTGPDPDNPLVGEALRSFWKNYSGVTRVGGRIGLGLSRGLMFTLDGENLLDEQRGEPDNVTVLPGRTVSAGLSLNF